VESLNRRYDKIDLVIDARLANVPDTDLTADLIDKYARTRVIGDAIHENEGAHTWRYLGHFNLQLPFEL
jgi:hypothetical protein